jgi:uncharacterized protein YgiM (DUF1202 family)
MRSETAQTRRTIVCAFLAVALMLVTVFRFGAFEVSAQSSAAFADGDAVAVNTDGLNLRDAAATSSTVLAVLPKGTLLTVISGPETVDAIDWYRVDADSVEGYVAGEYLVASSGMTFATEDLVVVNTTALNLRSEASSSADIVTVLGFGQGATVLAGPVTADSHDWYQVEADGLMGWVARDWLAYGIPTAASVQANASAPAEGTTLFVNTDTLNVREAASTTATSLETLSFGDTVTASGTYATADGYTWADVTTSSGTTGYTVADYLTEDETDLLLTDGASAVVADAELNLRATAGLIGEILTTLAPGDAVTITSASESVDGYLWYQVETHSGTGWVAGIYLTVD